MLFEYGYMYLCILSYVQFSLTFCFLCVVFAEPDAMVNATWSAWTSAEKESYRDVLLTWQVSTKAEPKEWNVMVHSFGRLVGLWQCKSRHKVDWPFPFLDRSSYNRTFFSSFQPLPKANERGEILGYRVIDVTSTQENATTLGPSKTNWTVPGECVEFARVSIFATSAEACASAVIFFQPRLAFCWAELTAQPLLHSHSLCFGFSWSDFMNVKMLSLSKRWNA